MEPSKFVLVTEASVLLGVSAETVRLWERSGRLPALRASGGVRLFARSDVLRLVEARANGRSAGV